MKSREQSGEGETFKGSRVVSRWVFSGQSMFYLADKVVKVINKKKEIYIIKVQVQLREIAAEKL